MRKIQICKESRRCILTFGKESCIFHVTILTFRNFGGSDSLLRGDALGSLRTVDDEVLWVEGKKE